MSGHRRHRDSPRVRRLAREAGVDLGTVTPSGPHGRVAASDLRATLLQTAGPGPSAPAAATRGQASSLLEVDATGLLRRADADRDAGTPGQHLLAAVVGSLARALSARRPVGLPAGPVAAAVDDDGTRTVVTGADLLSTAGVLSRLGGRHPAEVDPAVGPAVHVVGTGSRGTTVEVLPVDAGSLAVLSVGPAVRRPVVVLGPEGQEQIGIRSMVWLALTSAGGIGADDASALLTRVAEDVRRGPGGAR